jgi:hypothetical protein
MVVLIIRLVNLVDLAEVLEQLVLELLLLEVEHLVKVMLVE